MPMIPVLPVDKIVTKMRLPTPVGDADREEIEETILDVQASVEAYLGCSITPRQVVQRGCYPHDSGWVLDRVEDGVPLISIDSVAAETGPSGATGYFTVTYTCGYDAREDPDLRPILAFVRSAVVNDARMTDMWRTQTGQTGTVKSESAEGQSVSYELATMGADKSAKAGSGSPGTLPTLMSLDFWRVAGHRVHQGPTHTYDPTP